MDPGYLRCGTLLAARDGDEAEALDPRARAQAVARARRPPAALERGAPARAGAGAGAPARARDPRRPRDRPAQADRRARQGGDRGRRRAPDAARPSRGLTIAARSRRRGRARRRVRIVAEHVVVAAGPWSSSLDGIPAGARIPIHPVKGQILRLHDPAGPGLLTRVLRMTGGYLVPRGDGRYVLGATMEERGFDTTVTAGGAFELLRNAFELLPSVTELVIDELSAGLRPATPDNAPAIGPGAIPGLHWAVGHYRHGILLTPITAELVAGALVGETAVPDEFSPARFAGVGGGGMTPVGDDQRRPPRAARPARPWRAWSRRFRMRPKVAASRSRSRARSCRARSGRTSSCATAPRSRSSWRCRADERGGAAHDRRPRAELPPDPRDRRLHQPRRARGGARGVGRRAVHGRAAAAGSRPREARSSTCSTAPGSRCSRTPPAATPPATRSSPRSSRARRSRPTGSSSR